jgi:tetratricopeptide (TPR) repeat protein
MALYDAAQLDHAAEQARAARHAGTRVDARGSSITGATAAALDTYEGALAAFQSWRSGAEAGVESALLQAPGFVMAHVLQAYMLLCSRDPVQVQSASAVLARARSLPANERERMHLAVIADVLADDCEPAKTRLDLLLRLYPHDVLALQVGHAFDYLTGDIERMQVRLAGVLPAWSRTLPGYHAVLAMHAFSLEECGDYGRAEDDARAALELDPMDARAHHVMAHLFEMTQRPETGIRWLSENRERWGVGTVVATHCWWHLGLFLLASGQQDAALRLYDERIRRGQPGALGDLIDASALLWRIGLAGAETSARWDELATAWEPHIDDGYCSFTDLHAMLAFVGARDQERIRRLENAQAARRCQQTRYGATTRLFGEASCQALVAYGRGQDERAIILLAGLPAVAYRFGGSHAQRDVLHLTLLNAAARMRRAALCPVCPRTHAA